MASEYVTMKEAQEILGVSNYTMWRLVKEGELTAYQSTTDRRRKMILRSDLEKLTELHPVDGQKKAATEKTP